MSLIKSQAVTINKSDEEILAEFDENRLNYLSSVVDDIYDRINTANSLWQGAYRDEFVNNTSTSAGSSLSLYYNNFVKSFENIKQFKPCNYTK